MRYLFGSLRPALLIGKIGAYLWAGLATFVLLFAPATGKAAAEGNGGSVTGRVQNVVTGQYLNNARITVKGTDLVVFTDESGRYRLVNVPAGPAVIEAFFTGLDPQEAPVSVERGIVAEKSFELTSVARYGAAPDVLKLQAYLVSSDRETEAGAIATNEQRFAPNMKTVMATDSLGDVLGNSVGEFLKFIPGITAEYDGGDIMNVSVRGIGGDMTSVTSNGAPVANTFAGNSRAFDIRISSLNDIARIEMTKVPKPSNPADSLAGSIDLISKSAFEREGMQFKYGVSLVSDLDNLTFGKTPHSNGDKNTRKILPNGDFDLTLPIGKNFGLVLTGMRSDKYSQQFLSANTWLGSAPGTTATLERPYLQSHQLIDSPRSLRRTTFGLRADWRATPNSVLSFGAQWVRYNTIIGAMVFTTNAGANGTPTPATGTPISFGPDFTIGATGRGAVNMGAGSQTFEQETESANLNYRFDNGRWKIDAGATLSTANFTRDNDAKGHFLTFSAAMVTPFRISYSNITPSAPGEVRAYNNNNQEIDIYDIANYRASTANDNPTTRDEDLNSARLNVRRRLNFFPFPSSIQAGGAYRVQTRDSQQETRNFTFTNPAASLVPYLMQVFVNRDSGFGFRNIPWLSASRSWSAYQADPSLFTVTPAQAVAAETTRLNNSERLRESVSAYYLEGEASFFKSRLKVLTGVRFEKTEDSGAGVLADPAAVWVRNADGTFARNAAGARIRKPEAGAAGSMEELRLVRQERAYKATRSYDGYYPSLHLTYNLTDNLLARAGYARTYGRPNFTDIIPNATVLENDLTNEQIINDPNVILGTITVRNTGLKPWTANNYDLSLEYYTKGGGLYSAGVFQKDIKDFFGQSVRLATAADVQELGLDERYIGWNVSSTFNSGDARITGAEFNVRHSLVTLGNWARHFTVFANGTKLRLEGHQQANFSSFIPESANWGLSFSPKKFNMVARWNYRGLDKRLAQPSVGADGFNYIKARTTLDLSFGYQLTRRLGFSAGVNNVFKVPQIDLRYGSQTPAYARQFRERLGVVQIAAGIRGTF